MKILNEDYKSNMDIAALISKNAEGEYDAIQGYQELLAVIGNNEEDRAVIDEIISDEKNHAEKLNALMLKYDKIEPNKD